LVGHRADLVKNTGTATLENSSSSFRCSPVSSSKTPSPNVGQRGPDAVEHRVSAANLDPCGTACRIEPCAGFDKIAFARASVRSSFFESSMSEIIIAF
jgi:hypothetical protein